MASNDEILKQEKSAISRAPTALKRELPGALHHYTSQQGLLGILQGKKLWATDIKYLNDSEEFQFAISLAKLLLSEERDSGNETRASFAERAFDALEFIQSKPIVNVYVTSFSTHSDQLSQWRGYCPQGNGFSLGFNAVRLQELANTQHFDLIPCLYNNEHQRALILELISRAKTEKTLLARGDFFAVLLTKWGAAIKHPGFKEEDEWRLVTVKADADPLVRAGKSFLVPFIEFDLTTQNDPELELDSMMSGPTPHPELAEESLTAALSHYKVKYGVTYRSSIPFRNW